MYITLLPELLMQKFLNRMECKKEKYNLKEKNKKYTGQPKTIKTKQQSNL